MLLIAASILAARKLAQFDGGKRVPATISAIADAVRWAEEIMKAIDERWPGGLWFARTQNAMFSGLGIAVIANGAACQFESAQNRMKHRSDLVS